MCGMKINFHQSDLLTINIEDKMAKSFPQIFSCKVGTFPIKYLGVPLHYDKLRREDLQPIIDRIIRCISGWLGRHLTYKGKLILLCACIVSSPAYLMVVIKFPKWAIEAINSQMAHSFWGNMGDQHKYHLTNWGLITRKKFFGGLGIPNLNEFNMALLASSGKRFFDNKKRLERCYSFKYNTEYPNVLWSKSDNASSFWKSVTWALNASKTFYRWKIGNGRNVKLWHDLWVGECSLKVQFRELFYICNQPECTVSRVWDGVDLKLSFRRCADSTGFDKWNQLLDIIQGIPLSDAPDVPIWMLESNGVYSVKSFHSTINFGGVASAIGDKLWKILCPQNIHVFLWLSVYNKVLTGDDLAKRKNVDDPSCLFCNELEYVQHLFFDCIVAKCIWKLFAKSFQMQIMSCFKDICAL
uniref:Reverse transcriptase zinc-binding domain-containing protein n=1 Tax=Hordeum vulgare subsp. vulgare TaxID=112509 RepID=A0A8I7BK24_HORVV